MESLVDLTFWEIFFVALKIIPVWILASASWVLVLIGIGEIVVMVLGYFSAKVEKQ